MVGHGVVARAAAQTPPDYEARDRHDELSQIYWDGLAERLQYGTKEDAAQALRERPATMRHPFAIQSPRKLAQGMGLCLIPENSVSVAGLQVRPVIEPDLSRHVDVVTVAGRQRSPALEAFIKEAAGYRWPD